jgi:hypothetical protein
MASYAAFTALRDYLASEWPTTPLAWENESFDPAPYDAWVRVEVTSSQYEQESIGGGSDPDDNRWVEVGIIFFRVMVRAGSGTELARSYADTLTNLFRGDVLTNFEFRSISIGLGEVGTEDGNWWALPAHVEWERG